MFGSFKWMAAAALASFMAVVCAGGWAREWWIAGARLEAAVAARDLEWSTKYAAASARADLLAATQDIKALQAAQVERFRRDVERRSALARVSALERALADNTGSADPNPVAYPRRIARTLRR